MSEEKQRSSKRVRHRQRRKKRRTGTSYNPIRESMTIFAVCIAIACLVVFWFWTIGPVAFKFLNDTFGI